MSQSYNPYSYQANNIFNMSIPDWKKKKWMETPITKAQAESLENNLFWNVNKVEPNPYYTAGGTIGNPTAGIGDIGYIPPGPASQGYSGPVSQTGRPSVGMGKDFSGYSKSIDKTFAMAALQSIIPQNDETPAQQADSSGGKGGGNRMDELTQYASAIKLDDEKYPMLWRYS